MTKPVDIIAGVDIGGSHIGIGLYNHQNNEQLSLSEHLIQSSISPADLVELVVSVIKNSQREIKDKTSLISVGIGFPGQSKNGFLVAASNFPTWKNVPLAQMISDRLDHIPTTLMNDADAAIAAEVWGTDKYTNVRNAAMITLGTGVGFGLILDGRFYSGANGLIEGGHMIVNPNSDRICGCGQRGCIEMYASAKNAALTMERLSSSSPSNPPYNAKVDGAKGIFQRASQGDKIAQQVLQEVAENLAIFCINICRLVDPEVIIFGGGMAHAGDTLLKSVHESMMKHTWSVYPPTIRLEIAHQVGNAGVIGAALSGQSLYSHLHPKLPLQGEPSDPPPERPTSATAGAATEGILVSREVAILGAVSVSGLALLFFATSPASGLSATQQPTINSRKLFLFSHAVLVGVHLLGLLSANNRGT